MKKNISVLDDKTINQIAAGEVIESPASCVKELIENAVDATASQIEISFIAGGRKKIEVIDNGCGMNFEDALLALERHATSKIKKIEDMDFIQTMGFRGEALPSIASISKFTLKTSDGNKSTQVISYGGKLVDHSVSARKRGTSIEVESLFYNVPARLKFQKSVSSDSREITKTVMEQALAYPKIAFKVFQDGKTLFHLIPKDHFTDLENLHYRIETLYGRQLADDLIEVEIEREGIALKGFIAKAKANRPNRLGQHLFVNHRYVESKLVSMAIREGYSTRLSEGRFPIFFLQMALDPARVDVNVHPQKKELRFKDPFEVKKVITLMIDIALRGASLPTIIKTQVNKEVFFEKEVNYPLSKSAKSVDISLLEEEEIPYFPDPVFEVVPNIIGIYSPYIFVEAKSISSRVQLQKKEEKGLVIIHQVRAEQRILFDALLQRGKNLSVQNLLMPKTLEFSKTEANLIEEYLETFESLGIGLRLVGPNSFILDGLPNLIPIDAAKDLIENVLEDIKGESCKKSLYAQKKQILAMAISRSIYFPKVEGIQKAELILNKLFKCENFEYSPKGKPIFISLSSDELAKKFK